MTTKDGVAFAHPKLKPVELGHWTEKGSDPHQVIVSPDNQRVVATDGAKVFSNFGQPGGPIDAVGFGVVGWSENKHKPSVLSLMGERHLICTFNNGGDDDHHAVFRIPMDKIRNGDDITKLVGHKSRPVAAAVSKDGKRIVSADEGSTLIVWEGEKFEEKSRYTVGSGRPGFAAFALAPDGKTVAYVRTYGISWLGALPNRSSEVFELFVFDITDPPAKPTPIWSNETRSMPGKRSGPVSLVFSPDGTTLLAAFADPFTADTQTYGDIPKSAGVKVWERVPKK